MYKTMKVEHTSQAVKVGYSATMKGREIVEIRPQVSGLITKILIAEGQKVSKGQTLFVIDQVPYLEALNTAEAALKSAKAAEATAQLNYDSKKQLRSQQVISDYDLQTAQQALLSAQAQVAQAQLYGGEESCQRCGRHDSLPRGCFGQLEHQRTLNLCLRRQRDVGVLQP